MSKAVKDRCQQHLTLRKIVLCGASCNVLKDKKHPDRWKKNKAFLCKTADRGKGNLSFKEVLLQVRKIEIYSSLLSFRVM